MATPRGTPRPVAQPISGSSCVLSRAATISGTVAERAYRALFDYFVELDEQGRVELKHVCKVAGLGGDPYRDGSYEYYTSTEVVANDPKGIGALIMASVVFEGS